MSEPGYWKPDTLAARSKAGEAVDAYLRLAWRDASDADDKADWSDEELREANIDSKHLMRWLVVGAYEPILIEPSAKEGAMYLQADSGLSVDSFFGLLQVASDGR